MSISNETTAMIASDAHASTPTVCIQ